ncbi:hypothetical protein RRG08_045015 [Elysia crispata]|uniref:protein-ribulosamine 3-kinase n=1 Tax=Elysia crispata TaxID=231223 RepID=A0AAE0Y3K9_9GAST|nr:hypothetical protein RRG08_045015 [Elysia crispata]
MEVGHHHKERMVGAEEALKAELNTARLEPFGCRQSGCINDGMGFLTDHGPLFVKFNSNSEGVEMFRGEFESLVALSGTERISVPQPLKLIKQGDGSAMLVLEYLDMHQLSDFAALGEQVARLHLHNSEQKRKVLKSEQTITRQEKPGYQEMFGFQVPTFAGYSRQSNAWDSSWVNFFARKMDDYVNLVERKHNDRDARPLWHSLVPHLPKLFTGVSVEPALLHGDLWRGNIAQTHLGPGK